jgi:hypothetical protein
MAHKIPKNLQPPPPELKINFNITWIKDHVNKIQDKIATMELEGQTNPFDFEMAMIELYPDFYDAHPFLVKKLCKGGDLSILYKMLNQLENVESGNKSLAGVELRLGEELANQYLYPHINKK